MSFLKKLKKSFQDEMVASSSRAGGPHSTSSNNPFKPQPYSGANQPPPYAPVAPAGAAASYYGNTPQPQYPPMPGQYQQQQQQPMMPQQMPPQQMPPQQFQYQAPLGGTPNPLINPGTLPLPSMNGPAPGADDPYTFLRDFDTIILVDDSGSMSGGRWNQTAAALSTIVPIVTYYDSDGIDVYFINAPDRPAHHNIRTPAQVMEVFSTVRPQGATPTGKALNKILAPYMEKFSRGAKVKPVNIIVITDGVPTDDVESYIVKYAKKLDKLDADLMQVGIQFFQIGNDPEATEALRELDDELGKMRDVRDMVDTAPWRGSLEGDKMLKVVLGAVNKRLDRKKI